MTITGGGEQHPEQTFRQWCQAKAEESQDPNEQLICGELANVLNDDIATQMDVFWAIKTKLYTAWELTRVQWYEYCEQYNLTP